MAKIRILGIDPGLNHTGFGVIDVEGNETTFVTAGCIHVPTGELSERLAFIYNALGNVIDEVKPTLASAEIIFLNINPKATLLLGQARGAALTAAATHNLQVMEFSATAIKSSIVGSGRATKTQIQAMVATLLHIDKDLQADAADALACALTCAHALRLKTVQNTGLKAARTGKKTLRSTASKRKAWEALIKSREEKE